MHLLLWDLWGAFVQTGRLPDAARTIQVVHSDIGATIPGIAAEQRPQFAFELSAAVLSGDLPPDKFAVGLKAAGVDENESQHLADLVW